MRCALCVEADRNQRIISLLLVATPSIFGGLVAGWASIPQADPSRWPVTSTVRDWWLSVGTLEGVSGCGFRSLLLLVNWELWLECNARTFKRAERPVYILLLKIKDEARTWGVAGAKHLSALLEGA